MMINIKELSVGNWVKFPHGIEKITNLLYIESEGRGRLCAGFAGSATLLPVSVKYLEPIEITPEILEKNGIKKEYNILYDDFYYNDDVSITKVVDEWFVRIGATNSLYVKYVHQLQNALTLCGINKEIELPKQEEIKTLSGSIWNQ